MPKVVDITHEQLRELYIDKRLSINSCAEQLGCSVRTVFLRLQQYGIPVRSKSEARGTRSPGNCKRPSVEIIKEWYAVGGVKEIARCGSVHLGVAYQWMKHAGIEAPGHGLQAPPKQELMEVYNRLKTFAKVGKHYGVVAMTAKKWLKEREIDVHSGPHAWAQLSKDELLGLKEKHSWMDIADLHGVSYTAIRTLCLRYGIEIDPRPHKVRDLPEMTIAEMYVHEFRSMAEIADRFKVSENVIRRYLKEAGIVSRTAGYTSAAEREIDEFVQSLGVETKKIKPVTKYGKMELDIVIESAGLVIEYCGLYWHSEHPAHGLPRGNCYHHQKHLYCEDRGWRLITIFEDEWRYRKPQLKAFIRNCLGHYDRRLFARKTTVRPIEALEAREFCRRYHWQGATILHVQYAMGLFMDEELVGVMTLAPHHRQQATGPMVLNRLCFKEGVTVVGGASKLMSAARKLHSGPIVSWSDNRYSQGKVYQALGFVLEEELGPDYSYTRGTQPPKRRSKQSMKKSNTGCPPEITEKDWCAKMGWYRIWDCGKKRWRLG